MVYNVRRPVVFFRRDGSRERDQELEVAKRYFPVVTLRTEVPLNSRVIARYSAVPGHHELVGDLVNRSSILANQPREHAWIAEFDWYQDLKEITPTSWFEHEFPSCRYDGPFFVKGRTNSRKQRWNKLAFANDRREAVQVAAELSYDPEIAAQGIVYRAYVPLRTFERDFTGLPIANEFRFFFWRTRHLAHGFYWSQASDEAKSQAKLDDEGLRLAKRAARIAAQHATFFTIDVAERIGGGWIVVEVNSGEQAGPSEIDLDVLYRELRNAVDLEDVIDRCDVCGLPEGDEHWARAGGDVVCDVCGRCYNRHPMDDRHVGHDGSFWLHRICDGRLVKT